MTRPELDLYTCPLDGVSLIEASAGTGKTWHIGGLWLRLLLERALEAPQILVVTFTNAATAELRERLRARIVEALAVLRGGAPAPGDDFVPTLLHGLRTRHGLDDATLAQRLALALQGFDEAAIFTIHGFCQRALAELPLAAGVPMALTPLADDGALLQQAVNDFWRRHVAGDALDPALAAWLAARGDTPAKFAALLARRLRKPLSPCLWPAALDADEPVAQHALSEAYEAARACWRAEHAAVEGALRDAAPRLNAASYGADGLATALAGWQRWMHADDALAPLDLQDGKLELLCATTLDKRRRKSAAPPSHRFFALADALLAARRDTEQRLELQRLRLLRRLFDEAGAALRRRKRELRVVAYDDMLLNLHEQLQAAPALADALRARFPAVLVDEFQDTDPLQWAIVERVWGGGDAPLLLVGDPKQAIYGFRNADLHTYLCARDRASAVYALARNQRSSPALVDALNALFQAHGRSFLLPGLDVAPAVAGDRPRPTLVDRSAAGGDTGALQLWLLPRDGDGRPLLRDAALDAGVRATAAEVARLLREGSAGRVTLEGRPLEGSDVAVLVRTHAQGTLVRQALAALGVGSVALSQASVFHTAEAEELQTLLAAVLEPQRPGLLRAALATAPMGADAAALEALAQDEAGLDPWQERLAGWRACWLEQGIAAMLRRWQMEAGVAQRLLARPDGARRLANLLHLAERLHEASAQQGSPRALLRWLEQRRRQPAVDEADQLRLESDQHLVRIVTIHKAKGLEYGVVFCPLLWNAQAVPVSAGGMFEVHDAQGRPVLDLRAGLDPDCDEPALRRQLRLERAAETLRLAYVALTRAVHRCYLVVGSYAARSGKGISTQAGTRGVLNWLVAGGDFSDAVQWFEHTLGPQDIETAWQRLAARSSAIRLAPLPMARGEPLPAAPALELEALPPPRSIAPEWWLANCGALEPESTKSADSRIPFGLSSSKPCGDGRAPALRQAQGERVSRRLASTSGPQDLPTMSHESGGSDHDAWMDPQADAAFEAAGAAALPRDDVLRFPCGPAASGAVRAAFERADFEDPASWEAAAWAALRAHPQPGASGPGGEARERAHAAMLQRMLQDALSTEIAPGLRLRHLAPQRCLRGVEFTLPAPGLTGQGLQALAASPGLCPPLLEQALAGMQGGYVRGVMDLVFELEGRYWVAAWKPGLLGTGPADYAGQALARAVSAQGGELPMLLQTLALERWLRRRVPGYRHGTHFGGALLLFVRGVRPGWRQADGTACGVWRMRLEEGALRTLEGVLEAPDASGSRTPGSRHPLARLAGEGQG